MKCIIKTQKTCLDLSQNTLIHFLSKRAKFGLKNDIWFSIKTIKSKEKTQYIHGI